MLKKESAIYHSDWDNEYHAHHASCGCDTMVINGIMRELEKTKEICGMPSYMVWSCKLCSRGTGDRYYTS